MTHGHKRSFSKLSEPDILSAFVKDVVLSGRLVLGVGADVDAKDLTHS